VGVAQRVHGSAIAWRGFEHRRYFIRKTHQPWLRYLRPMSSHRFRNILVAYDDTEGARAALRRAAELAARSGAALTLVQATREESETLSPLGLPNPARHPDPEDAARARHSLEQAIGELDPSLEASPWVVGGPAGKGIIAVAGDIHADLIVTGSRGRGRFASTVLGSVSTELAHDAPCDVLVVHPLTESE
jgi:nucleotide-binding universal stress UspA family protein